VHPDDQPLRWHELKEPGSSLMVDFRFKHIDGSWRWFEGHGVNLLNDPNIGALLFNLREITERKEFEFAITAQNKSLQLKNEELEQFAYIASHDLQEPLRSLSSFSNLLMRKCAGVLDEQSKQYLDFIQSSSERMKMLVSDLLEYARIGKESRLEAADTQKIVTAVLDDLHFAIEQANATITVGTLPHLVCYPTELRLLLQNLLSNALKFVQPNRPPQIYIEAKNLERHYQFSVVDNGIGIQPQFHEKVFLIFKRLHQRDEFDGSGIGLAHCKKVAEIHQGDIWFESTPGEGSTFYFTISKHMEIAT
jgi:light-regulated signal transduction histidine kinase (bacteriophytochrome)